MAHRESVSATDITRGFVDQQGAAFHDAFGVGSSFNTAVSRYQPHEVFGLEETLRQYQSQAPEQPDFDFDLLKCTWHDVLRELERAQAAATESDNQGKKLHRKVWRALGTTGSVLAPGLSAIPDDLCVLHGGLAVIFSLARHRSESRQKILRAFEDIPNVIMMAYGKAESIPRDRPESNRLHAMIGELQQTLLATLPVLIDRLNPRTFVAKALSSTKGFEIDDLLGTVRSSSERVRACAEGIMDNIIVNSHQTIHSNHRTTTDIHMITQQTEGEVGELREKIDEILKHQRSFQVTLDAVSGKNSLLSFLMEYLKTGQQEGEMRSQEPSPVRESVAPAASLTPRQLLGLMNVHHLGALDDEQHIIRRGHSMNSDAISHASTMFQTTQVRQLLHSPESGVVLVNGCTDRSQNTKVSPLTHVCATLTHALRRSPDANVVLAFFCGQHSTSNDGLTGPQGLMRSLVAYLVLSLVQNGHISDSAPIQIPNFQGDLDELAFKNICQLFYHLVELVPKETTVYCVVDGISYYERQAWRSDYNLMMDCFGGIIANKGNALVFKLLLTSPTVSRWLPDLKPHQQVSLRNSRARGAASAEAYLQTDFGHSTW